MIVNEIDPDIENLHAEIRRIVYQSNRKKRQKVMHMILTLCAGKVYQLFHQWKKYTQVHTKVILENTKRRILTLHKTRMQDAMAKWTHVIAHNKKMKKR